MAFQQILLATDLTKNSLAIAKRVREFADAVGAKLSIVHVMAHAPVAYAGEFSIPIDAELEIKLKKQAKERLSALADQVGVAEDARYIKEGSIKKTVVALAKEIQADLLVTGARSHKGIAALLGSQANAISHAAPCDVWIVHS